MSDPAQVIVALVVICLAGLLVLRLLLSVPGWIRRARMPETRLIRVVGVGGGGSNAVDRMVAARLPGVSFVACNTDAQALRQSTAADRVRIGEAITRGLGSGGDPEIGRRAAEESEARIARTVAGADLVFITAGLGGGTGSGAAPVIGASARLQGALTIAVVTRPFAFEGVRRRRVADAAVIELAASVDAIITIPNDRVAGVVAEDASMLDAFRVVDDVIVQAVRGIIEMLNNPGLVNVDFADVRAIMHDAGPALIGLGSGTGEDRAIDAARQAIASPLLEGSIQGARGILFNVSGPPDLRLREVLAAADEIRSSADRDASVIFGASLDRAVDEGVLITLIATGLDRSAGADAAPPATASTAAGPVETGVHARRRRPGPPKAAADPGAAAGPGEKGAEPAAVPGPGEVQRDDRDAEGRPAAAVDAAADAGAAGPVDLEVPSFLRQRQSP